MTDVNVTGSPGAPGQNGTLPGQAGTNGGNGGAVTATDYGNGVDTTNIAEGTGGARRWQCFST